MYICRVRDTANVEQTLTRDFEVLGEHSVARDFDHSSADDHPPDPPAAKTIDVTNVLYRGGPGAAH